ncbi:MAG: hypothetical protein R3F23_06655 [Verrucomicrobiia bacterium]
MNGLTRGAIYALVALGYTMVYGILGMINFAHGEIFMIGMFASVFAIGSFTTLWGDFFSLNLVLGLFFAVLIASAFGYSNERIAYRKLRHAHILAPLTSAIGLSIVLQNFIMLSVSKDKILFPSYYSDPLMLNTLKIGSITMTYLLRRHSRHNFHLNDWAFSFHSKLNSALPYAPHLKIISQPRWHSC